MLDQRFLSQSLGLLNPPPGIQIDQDQPVASAIRLLQEHRSGCLLVVRADGTLAGIFTERDIVLKLVLQDIDLEKTPVSTFMTVKPETAQMTTTVAYALNMMSHGGFRHIPIVDSDNIPVGLVSVKNLVDFLARSIGKLVL